MKKIYVILFALLLLLNQGAFCFAKQSLNTFNISISEVPSSTPAPPKDNSSKLSDGAITAIVLGSTFGGLGVLSGIGYYFYKNLKELKAGLVCGQKCPYQTISFKEFCAALEKNRKYTYLMKASQKSVSEDNYRYLIIPDTQVKTKTFNTIFFELPKTNSSKINFRIIQASKPYKIEKNLPNLDTNIFTNPKDKNVKKVPTYTKELNSNEGYLIKNGTISDLTSNVATITTENLSNKNNQIYAIIVEFFTDNN